MKQSSWCCSNHRLYNCHLVARAAPAIPGGVALMDFGASIVFGCEAETRTLAIESDRVDLLRMDLHIRALQKDKHFT